MQALIFAGGRGTRFAEETSLKPKPMIEIGGMPMLWHIMKIYAQAGVSDFIIAGGYKSECIKEWLRTYYLRGQSVEFCLKTGKETLLSQKQYEDWTVKVVETGDDSGTALRLKKCLPYIEGDSFFMTYGDGVSNVNLKELLLCHQKSKLQVTMTGVHPQARFGAIEHRNGKVIKFKEKPKGDGHWINGGFFVVNKEGIEQYVSEKDEMWEDDPLKLLTEAGQLGVYLHDDFWMPMDTLRDKMTLENLWNEGSAPWKTWD